MSADKKEGEEELTPKEKVMAMVGYGLGMSHPDDATFWKVEGLDLSTLDEQEKDLFKKIRADQWATSCALVMHTLEQSNLFDDDVQREGFKFAIQKGHAANDTTKE